MEYAQWGATIFSLIYLYYAIKNNPVCFIWGILGSVIWAYVSFSSDLIFDGGLQIFYVLMSLVGIYRWIYGGDHNKNLPISQLRLSTHIYIVAAGGVVTGLLIWLSQFIASIQFTLPILDATTTIFLIIGTLLLVERKLYSWVYLVIADLGYVILYAMTDLWIFVGLMIIYIVFGIVGFTSWYSLSERQNPQAAS